MTARNSSPAPVRGFRQVSRRLQAAALAFRNDGGPVLSAALVYFGMVSMVPLLIMLMAVPGLLLRFLDVPQAIADDVLGFAERIFGDQFRAFLEQAVADLQRDSLIASLIALGALLFSASLIFRFISLSFRRIWKPLDHQAASMSEAMRKTATEKAVDRLVGFLMALGVSLVLVLSVILSTVVPLVLRLLGRIPFLGDLAGWMLPPALTLVTSLVIFLLLFKYVPPVPMRWGDVWLGALLGAVGWEASKQALQLYILIVGTRSSYGALSVLMAMLFWFNANGRILFFCAELCKVTAMEREGLPLPMSLPPDSTGEPL